jgi:hypothetical protein
MTTYTECDKCAIRLTPNEKERMTTHRFTNANVPRGDLMDKPFLDGDFCVPCGSIVATAMARAWQIALTETLP